MTEEINHSYDGGLYGELIQNRAFKDDANSPVHWSLVQDGGGAGRDRPGHDPAAQRRAARQPEAGRHAAAARRVGVANDGYWGIPVRPNTPYRASFYAKAAPGFAGPLTVDIESRDGATVYATAAVPTVTAGWQQYTVTLTTGGVTPTADARFVISANKPGTVWLNLVSLFPPTYHNRPNGNRTDLMQKLAAMQPAFLRLPGGNYLEGNTIAERFDWKKTLGAADRPSRPSGAVGLPLDGRPGPAGVSGVVRGPAHAAGAGRLRRLRAQRRACRSGAGAAAFRAGRAGRDRVRHGRAPSTNWGARRAPDGHPAPFPLTYVEIGNEDGFDRSGSYDGRFAQFYDAIKAKYPNLQADRHDAASRAACRT